MISRQKFNRTKLLYNTLTETLILFLFILLAIAAIYNRMISEQKVTIENNKLIPAGHLTVDKHDYEDYLNNKEDLENSIEEKYSSLVDSLNKKIIIGVGPPPCILDNGKKVLLEIDFIQNRTYLVKVVNIDQDLKLNNSWTLEKDSLYVLNESDFKKLGYLLHESKKINELDPDCDQKANPKRWSSSYCYECVYIYKLVNFKENPIVQKYFPWSANLDIGSEETKNMLMTAQIYFYSTK